MIYIIMSFIAGAILVINISISGKIANEKGKLNGVLLNFLVSSLTSLLICIIMGSIIPDYKYLSKIPSFYFIGGMMGVMTTYIYNLVVHKVPIAYVMILSSVGQIGASVIFDYLYLDKFSVGKLVGGVLFLMGLMYNEYIDLKYKKEANV